MIPIYIPSRSRADYLPRGILTKLPKDLDPFLYYVVPVDQIDQYKQGLSNIDRQIQVLGAPVSNIAEKRAWIIHHCNMLGQQHHIQADDDLEQFAVRKSADDYHLRKADDNDIMEMLDWVENSLHTYAHVGISARGNNLIRNGHGPITGPCPLAQENVRMFRFLGYQTDKLLKVQHNRMATKEDFDINLQLLRMGYPNIVSFWWTHDQRQTALPGGCQDYRTLENHAKDCALLQSYHPDFVRMVNKKNIGKVTHNQEFQERTEVVVSWKQAYKEGLKRKEQEELRMHNL